MSQESVNHGPHSDGSVATGAGHERAGRLDVLLGVFPGVGVLQEMGVNRDPVTQASLPLL